MKAQYLRRYNHMIFYRRQGKTKPHQVGECKGISWMKSFRTLKCLSRPDSLRHRFLNINRSTFFICQKQWWMSLHYFDGFKCTQPIDSCIRKRGRLLVNQLKRFINNKNPATITQVFYNTTYGLRIKPSSSGT